MDAQSIRKRLEEKKREIEAKLAASASSSSELGTSPKTPVVFSDAASLGSYGSHAKKAKQFHTSSDSGGSEGLLNSSNSGSSAVSAEMSGIIHELAKTVARAGSVAEIGAANAGDPRYEFLNYPLSPECLLYQRRLQELKPVYNLAKGVSATREVSPVSTTAPVSDFPSASASRKRSSRWGPPPAQIGSPAAFPPLAVGPMLDEERAHALQLVQLRQQLAVRDVVFKAKAGAVDEEFGGGPSTEHLQRAAEMAKTKELASKLTQPLGEGKHHIQDFLPKEELAKFEENLRKQGSSSSMAQYEENKLDESNVGFKMLKKFGWMEGKGLGASGAGIAAPISSVTPLERAGLGTKRPDEPSDEDDEFSLYRKRMMLAYKYRPNPLNNPRRPYY